MSDLKNINDLIDSTISKIINKKDFFVKDVQLLESLKTSINYIYGKTFSEIKRTEAYYEDMHES